VLAVAPIFEAIHRVSYDRDQLILDAPFGDPGKLVRPGRRLAPSTSRAISATFDRISIRKTARALRFATEAARATRGLRMATTQDRHALGAGGADRPGYRIVRRLVSRRPAGVVQLG